MIDEKEMMITHGAVYPYGLFLMFGSCNIILYFKNRNMDDCIYAKKKKV